MNALQTQYNPFAKGILNDRAECDASSITPSTRKRRYHSLHSDVSPPSTSSPPPTTASLNAHSSSPTPPTVSPSPSPSLTSFSPPPFSAFSMPLLQAASPFIDPYYACFAQYAASGLLPYAMPPLSTAPFMMMRDATDSSSSSVTSSLSSFGSVESLIASPTEKTADEEPKTMDDLYSDFDFFQPPPLSNLDATMTELILEQL